MGSLERRLSSLEEHSETSRRVSAVSEKEQWLALSRRYRREQMPEEVRHARDLIGLFRQTGSHYPPHRLSERSAQDLAHRILDWRPVPEGGRRRPIVEREVYRAVYEEEEGLEHMVCPPQWAESFEAGEELEAKYANIPDSLLAAAYARILEAPGGEEEVLEFARTLESYGITAELQERAIGPDMEEIPEEEQLWRLGEYLADVCYGERGFQIKTLVEEL